jgi:hypothetical protein
MIAHFWFHPSMDEWYIENVMPSVLEFIHKLENEGLIELLTMGQLAERVISNKKLN